MFASLSADLLLKQCHFPGIVGGGSGAAGVVVEVLVGGVAAAVPQQVRLVAAVAAALAVSALAAVGLQKYSRESKNAERRKIWSNCFVNLSLYAQALRDAFVCGYGAHAFLFLRLYEFEQTVC